jgi:hypothetical protein
MIELKVIQNDLVYLIKLEILDLGSTIEIILSNMNHNFFIENDIIVKGEYPFFVLMELREILEKNKIFILCNGSRFDVFPSNMSKIGFKAYINKIGKSSMEKDLVNIFDECEDMQYISTVQRQKDYNMEWMNFFRQKNDRDFK